MLTTLIASKEFILWGILCLMIFWLQWRYLWKTRFADPKLKTLSGANSGTSSVDDCYMLIVSDSSRAGCSWRGFWRKAPQRFMTFMTLYRGNPLPKPPSWRQQGVQSREGWGNCPQRSAMVINSGDFPWLMEQARELIFINSRKPWQLKGFQAQRRQTCPETWVDAGPNIFPPKGSKGISAL